MLCVNKLAIKIKFIVFFEFSFITYAFKDDQVLKSF